MNLCLIYLTEWARELINAGLYMPQRWIVSQVECQGCVADNLRAPLTAIEVRPKR